MFFIQRRPYLLILDTCESELMEMDISFNDVRNEERWRTFVTKKTYIYKETCRKIVTYELYFNRNVARFCPFKEFWPHESFQKMHYSKTEKDHFRIFSLFSFFVACLKGLALWAVFLKKSKNNEKNVIRKIFASFPFLG